jgi:8-oxo-dGTP diphosphatase
MARLVPAASALVIHADLILFVRSTRTREKWAFPGGKTESGETPRQTAVREVREEVGLEIQLTRKLGTYHTDSGFEIVCFVATTRALDLKLDASEIIEARWCEQKDAFGLDLIPTAREALEQFAATYVKEVTEVRNRGDRRSPS